MVARAIDRLDLAMLHPHRCADGWGADAQVSAMVYRSGHLCSCATESHTLMRFQTKPGTLNHLEPASRKPEEIRIRSRSSRARRPAGTILFSLFVICCLAPALRGKQANTDSARVEGPVFFLDSAGNQSFVAGAKVKLNGPATLETETDGTGKYVVAAVPVGFYTVEAEFPGL